MTLVPFKSKEEGWWDPFRDLETIQHEMNKLFDFSPSRHFARGTDLLDRAWSPALDVYESTDNIVVKADLPGMNREDLDVSVHGDTLAIKGEKKQTSEVKEKDFVRMERAYGSFYRTIALPEEVDAGNVKAVYKDGVLELTLPKKEDAKPRHIRIEVK